MRRYSSVCLSWLALYQRSSSCVLTKARMLSGLGSNMGMPGSYDWRPELAREPRARTRPKPGLSRPQETVELTLGALDQRTVVVLPGVEIAAVVAQIIRHHRGQVAIRPEVAQP